MGPWNPPWGAGRDSRRTHTNTYTEQRKHENQSIDQLISLLYNPLFPSNTSTQSQASLAPTLELHSTNGACRTVGITLGWMHSWTNTQMVLVQQPQQPEETQFTHTVSEQRTHFRAASETPNEPSPEGRFAWRFNPHLMVNSLHN